MPTARAIFWIATAGALALVVRVFWLGPIPAIVPLLTLTFYVTFLILGVIFPRWGVFADVIESAQPGRNVVALTFDDGPSYESTPRVLELLAQHGAKATFFVIGRKVEQAPELLRAIVEAGHELGLHGYAHSRLTAFRSEVFIQADVTRARQVLAPYTPAEVRWFRPPIGHVTLRVGRVAKRLGLHLVCWTVRGLDGLPGVEPARVIKRIRNGLEDGGIVALHDAFERRDGVPAGVTALDAILTEIEHRGWRAVTLTELLQGEPSAPATAISASDRNSEP